MATNFCFDVELVKELRKVIENKYKNKRIDFLVLQFGAEQSKVATIKGIGKIIYHERKMNADDFRDINLPEWQIFDKLKIKKFKNIIDKYKYKIWRHLGKELKQTGLIN